MNRLATTLTLMAIYSQASFAQSDVVREDVDGIVNFSHIETTVACAGAITPESVADIKAMGFASIINLRESSEPGANIDAEAAAAKAAGIKFVHLPFGRDRDPTVADRFLETITAADTEPAFIHCAGGGRAAMMWFIKRVIVDEWAVDRALEEARALGLSETSGLNDFALEYVSSHSG